MNINLKKIPFIFFASILLIAGAIYNQFPVLNYDSGAYIYNAYANELPFDRPVFYSYFIKFISLKKNLWLVVFSQSLIISFLLVQLLNYFFSQQKYSFLIIFLTAFSSQLIWNIAYLTPDIFTSISFLCIILILISKNSYLSILYHCIFFISLIMHNANILICIIFCSIILFISFFLSSLKPFYSKTASSIFIIICAYLFSSSIIYKETGNFTMSKGSHAFMVAKTDELGILEPFLNEHCAKNKYLLCEYKNQLPHHFEKFLFEGEQGVFHKVGSWKNTSEEFNKIIKDILMSHTFRNKLIQKISFCVLKQLTLTNVYDDVAPYLEDSNPYWKINEHYSHQLSAYLNSKQSKNTLPISSFNNWYKIFIPICLIVSILFLFFIKNKRVKYFFYVVILFVIINAVISGTFTTVFSRLNSRVIWLMPLSTFCIIFTYLIEKRKIKEAKNQL